MLNIEVNGAEGICHIEASGDALDLTAEMCMAIGGLYKSFRRPMVRRDFRNAIQKMVFCNDLWNAPEGMGVTISIPKEYVKGDE